MVIPTRVCLRWHTKCGAQPPRVGCLTLEFPNFVKSTYGRAHKGSNDQGCHNIQYWVVEIALDRIRTCMPPIKNVTVPSSLQEHVKYNIFQQTSEDLLPFLSEARNRTPANTHSAHLTLLRTEYALKIPIIGMVERWRIELQSTACKAIIISHYTNAPYGSLYSSQTHRPASSFITVGANPAATINPLNSLIRSSLLMSHCSPSTVYVCPWRVSEIFPGSVIAIFCPFCLFFWR